MMEGGGRKEEWKEEEGEGWREEEGKSGRRRKVKDGGREGGRRSEGRKRGLCIQRCISALRRVIPAVRTTLSSLVSSGFDVGHRRRM